MKQAVLLLFLASSAFAADRTLDARLAQIFKDGKIPGATVAIVENGEITFAKGYGYADVAKKIAATADTPFRAGSISKSVTSIAVMTLVEQKKLALDAPIATLVPDLHSVNQWESTDPVRLVHLLEHTTGWPDISTRVLAQDGKGWTTLQGLHFMQREFVSRWKPGRFMVYDNAGPGVAGYAIERVTGQTFEQYVRDQVLRPMGMAAADFDLTPELAPRIAKSYMPDGAESPYQYIILRPAGSLNVSARELAQLVRFYLNEGSIDGHQILTPASIARIERGETNLGARFGFTDAYGLGNAPFPDHGLTFRGHNGSIDSFTSVFGYNRRTRSGYVLMANGGEGVDFATPAAKAIQEYLTRGVAMTPPPTVTLPDARRYNGWYHTITPPNDLLRPYAEVLSLNHVSFPDPKLIATGPHTFRRSDRESASQAFVEDGGETYKIGTFSAQRRVSIFVVIATYAIGFIIVAGALIGLVMLLRRKWLGVLPLASIAALAVAAVLPIRAFIASGTSAVRQLAEVCPYSLTILACSVLFPLLALAGLVLSVRNREATRFLRAYTATTSLALLVVAVYLAAIGWLPLRTWVM
ncbi:MAG TPA: serine hydrolase domain-containing protein [Thermoanaerobaculia bacterium]|nr:serine hydrolase domain-containing protein [Thermoanaerobaculia bacterium]